jgi:DNA gyrase subunit A
VAKVAHEEETQDDVEGDVENGTEIENDSNENESSENQE